MLKTNRIHSGTYEYKNRFGQTFRIEKFYRDHEIESCAYWSWYLHNGLTSFGEDQFTSKKHAIEGLYHWLSEKNAL